MKLKILAALAMAASFYSCDDETTGIGKMVTDIDQISTFTNTYSVETSSYIPGAIYSRSSTAYLGKFTDESYGEFSSDFLTQINCPEDFEMPENIEEISSAYLSLYYDSYFGDSLATMRVQIDELTKPITDDGTDKSLYYTNLNPEDYYDKTAAPIATKTYTAYDMTISDSLRSSTDSYSPNVTLSLGSDFCKKFLAKYQENKNYFKDAESFINNVLKGFYVHTTGGEGSILYITDIYLRLYVKYHSVSSSTGNDTILTTSIPMAATKEVFMSTRFKNKDLSSVVKDDDECTYLKSPAGIYTEVTLPIEELYEAHKTDTLNSVAVSFQKLKDTYEGPYKMGVPSTLLMVRKNDMKSFFEDNKVYDSKTSFLSSYTSTSATYTFSKLNRLVSYIFSEIRDKIEEGGASWEAWKKANEGWDKVLLIPVSTDTDSSGNIIGVSNDLSVNSATLLRGIKGNAKNNIQMTIYGTRP